MAVMYPNLTNETAIGKERSLSSHTCGMAEVHLTVLIVLFVTGFISNILLLLFVVEQRTPRLSPDKILILNFAAANLLGLLVSLPFHFTEVILLEYFGLIAPQDSCYFRFLTTITLLFFFATDTFNVAIIAFDRSDALKNLVHNRKLNSLRAKLAVCTMWLVSLLTTCASSITKIQKIVNMNKNQLCPAYQNILKDQSLYSTMGFRPGMTSIIIVIIWVVPGSLVVVYSLVSVTVNIRNHRQKIESMFGPRKAFAEINFTKVSFAFVITYVSTWAPLGVITLLNHQLFCGYFWARSLSYMNFVLIPIVYMVMDKRFWATIKNRFKCNWMWPCGKIRTQNFNTNQPPNNSVTVPSLVVSYRKTSPAITQSSDINGGSTTAGMER